MLIAIQGHLKLVQSFPGREKRCLFKGLRQRRLCGQVSDPWPGTKGLEGRKIEPTAF